MMILYPHPRPGDRQAHRGQQIRRVPIGKDADRNSAEDAVHRAIQRQVLSTRD